MNRSARERISGVLRCLLLPFALGVSPQSSSARVDLPIPVQEVLDGYVSHGIDVVDTFQATGGWIGVAATVRQQGLIFYLDQSGEHLFMGMMLGARGGVNHTEALLREYFPDQYAVEQSVSTAAQISGDAPLFTAQELATIPGVRYRDFEGDPLSQLYLFVDFACDHCRSLYDRLRSDALRRVIAEQRIALIVIPLAFSGEQTAFKSAYALSRQPSSEDLRALFGSDAPLPTDMSKDEIAPGAMDLTQVMNAVRAHGISSVPVLFLTRDDAVRVGSGSPDQSSILEFLALPSSP